MRSDVGPGVVFMVRVNVLVRSGWPAGLAGCSYSGARGGSDRCQIEKLY